MVDVDVDLRRHEGGPHQTSSTVYLVSGEWHSWAWAVERGDVVFARAVGEHHVEGQEHAIKLGCFALGLPVDELWRQS